MKPCFVVLLFLIHVCYVLTLSPDVHTSKSLETISRHHSKRTAHLIKSGRILQKREATAPAPGSKKVITWKKTFRRKVTKTVVTTRRRTTTHKSAPSSGGGGRWWRSWWRSSSSNPAPASNSWWNTWSSNSNSSPPSDPGPEPDLISDDKKHSE